jgi:hypothetical protein
MYKQWKATEFRQFALYTSFIVVKILPKCFRDHFYLLSCALRILLCRQLCKKYCSYAANLLPVFVTHSAKCYTNIHSLIHLPEDAKKFGELDTVSAFPFENAMKFIRNCVRSPAMPLQQLARRISENTQRVIMPSAIVSREPRTFPINRYFIQFVDGKIVKEIYKSYTYSNFVFTSETPNNILFTVDYKHIYRIRFIFSDQEGVVFFAGNKLSYKYSAFSYPLPSSTLNIYKVCENDFSETKHAVPFSEVLCKAIMMPLTYPSNNHMFILAPLLHH